MKAIKWIALILLIIGGLNWGLVGIFNFDLVATIFGAMSLIARIVYAVVGVCALIILILSPSMVSCKQREHFSQPQQ